MHPLHSAFELFRSAGEIVLPRLCHACLAPLPPVSSLACPSCRRALVAVDEWDDAYRDALRRMRENASISDLVAVWYFEPGGVLRALMHALKYRGVTSLGVEFGRALGARISEAGLAESDMVLPLPLHPSRMRERGFNQCAFIARGVSAVTGRPVRTGLLRRTRFTPSQTPLGVSERRENVRGAFALRAGAQRAIRGRTILLVDDVVTTGATMCSCAELLRDAGARSVVACAVAIAR